ncbi:MAG TPA: hypothetical protein P5550_07875 [Bacteroidales bacterium]|nr:hypothetical protein [Bacteroidales bacterium]
MKRFLYLIFSIPLLGICQCNHTSGQQDMISSLKVEYDSSRSFFNPTLVSHIPEGYSESTITFTEALNPFMGNLEFIVVDSLSDELNDQVDSLTENAIASFIASDTCLNVVNQFLSLEKYTFTNKEIEELDARIYGCWNDLPPVPNFWHTDYTTEDTRCKLPNDFVLYVIEAKPGMFVDESLVTNAWFMPKEWEHGFSRGIAISENRGVIIYWLVIW